MNEITLGPFCVAPANVSALWRVVEPMIQRAYTEVDEFAPPDMFAAFERGSLLLWVAPRDGDIGAILVTALLPRPSGLACKLVAAAGIGAGEWASWHRRIEAYARAEGCAKMFAEGRVGWGRVLPGYATKRLVLEKRLER